MKALKLTVVIIFVIVILLLLIPLFLPDTVTITEKSCMKASPELVFRQVNILKNRENWSPLTSDSTLKITYAGATMGVGATYSWKGKKMGKGSLTIEKSEPYRSIQNKLDFGPQGKVVGLWQFKKLNDSVCVTWSVTMLHLKYPFGRWLGLMMKSGMKPLLNKGLHQMKLFVEKQNPLAVIKEDSLTSQPVLLINDSTTLQGIDNLLGKNFGKLMQYTRKHHISIAGAPFAIYYNWNPQGMIHMGAGLPIATKSKGYGDIVYSELPAGKTLVAKHFGSYDTGTTHEQLDDYMTEHHLSIRKFIWEVYVTNPVTQPDTSQWETDIYYPVKRKP